MNYDLVPRYGIIYKIVNKLNGKIYIGQTVKSVDQRLREHTKGNSYLSNSLKKHDTQSFEISVIDSAENKKFLNEKEKHWIRLYNCKVPNGYNLTDGGEGADFGENNVAKRPEVRKKLRDNNCMKRSEVLLKFKGENNSFFGKHHTKESKIGEKTKEGMIKSGAGKKISSAKKGQKYPPRTEEYKRKMSLIHKGKIVSEETRMKLRKPKTEETKRKISIARKGKYAGENHPMFGKKRPDSRIRMCGENNPMKNPEIVKKSLKTKHLNLGR
jgi:group I intron endonuclease